MSILRHTPDWRCLELRRLSEIHHKLIKGKREDLYYCREKAFILILELRAIGMWREVDD